MRRPVWPGRIVFASGTCPTTSKPVGVPSPHPPLSPPPSSLPLSIPYIFSLLPRPTFHFSCTCRESCGAVCPGPPLRMVGDFRRRGKVGLGQRGLARQVWNHLLASRRCLCFHLFVPCVSRLHPDGLLMRLSLSLLPPHPSRGPWDASVPFLCCSAWHLPARDPPHLRQPCRGPPLPTR